MSDESKWLRSKEALRKRVAELCGWTQLKDQFGSMQGIKPPLRGWLPVPDYPNDRNAIIAEIEKLSDEEFMLFRQALDKIWFSLETDDDLERFRMTAQPCYYSQAFVAVKGGAHV